MSQISKNLIAVVPVLIAGIIVPLEANAAVADVLNVSQALPGQDGPDVGETRILVDGPSTGGYNEVETRTVDLWLRVSLRKPTDLPTTNVTIDNISIESENKRIYLKDQDHAVQRYKLSFPYVDPFSGTVSNQRNSPIALCNDRLRSLSGPALQGFLNNGAEIAVAGAYPVLAKARVRWWTTQPHQQTQEARIRAKATVVCKALARPRPRTEPPTTRGVDDEDRRPGTRLPPVISEASLRISPAQMSEAGGQLCPAQLRLHARVQASRAFEGKAIIFGTGFLTPVTQLNYTHGGNRNFVAGYPLRWDRVGGLSAGSGDALKSQTVSLTMNITTMEDKVVKQVQETVTVTCKQLAEPNAMELNNDTKSSDTPARIGRPPGTAASTRVGPAPVVAALIWDGAAVAEPRPARARRTYEPIHFVKRIDKSSPLDGVDAAIRLVDRRGPGGATRLFVRNGGTVAASQCTLFAAKRDHEKWIVIESMAGPVAAGSTVEVKANLPRDPGTTFALDCPGEEENRLDNNLALLD